MSPEETATPAAAPDPITPAPGPSPLRTAMSRGLILIAMVFLLQFIGRQATALWREWKALQVEREQERDSVLVGYVDIHPVPQYAAWPPDWVHDEGDDTLLWAGWQPGVGHRWFRIGRGELNMDRVAGPLGRDSVRAIDVPIVEVGRGPRWERIPWDAPVAVLDVEGVPSAYPLRLLERVEVVNDQVRGRPVLVTFSPFAPRTQAFNVYEPIVAGRRVTLGSSGYFLERRPLLYDRGTESLWVERREGLAAVAGRRKGMVLRRLSLPTLMSWGDWRDQYPTGRLIVGADRSGGLPTH